MPAGRPRIIETPEEMWEKANLYFEQNPLTPSISELSLELGFVDRQSFYDYEKNFPEFTGTIKKIRSKIVGILEKYSIDPDRKNISGPIFMLKNFGYSDKVDINQSIEGKLEIEHKQDPALLEILGQLSNQSEEMKLIEGEFELKEDE